MQNRNEQVDQVREFLALYPMDMWWPDLNSECRPLAAETTVGVYSLVRICCPALGDARDAIVAGMVRAAGFRLAPRDGGGYVVEGK